MVQIFGSDRFDSVKAHFGSARLGQKILKIKSVRLDSVKLFFGPIRLGSKKPQPIAFLI